jgi:hypothetical protein
MGGAGLIVGSTIGLYVVTTICAALIGVVTSLIFSGFYDVVPQYSEVMPDPHVQIGCGTELNADGTATHYLRLNNEGIFECSDVVVGSNNTFLMFDVNGYFQQSMNAAGPVNLSLGESIYQVSRSHRIVLFTQILNSYEQSSHNMQLLFLASTGTIHANDR